MADAAHRHTAPEPLSSSGTLLVTAEGIFLWPGSPLLTKRGGRFVLRPRDRIYDLVCRLHGPRAAWTPLVPTLEQAAARLNDADIGAARLCLDRLNLPPLSRAGVDLMRAIAKRLGLEPLSLPLAPNDNVGLRPDLAVGLAESYDAIESAIWAFCKIEDGEDFNTKHPRQGASAPNPGWFGAGPVVEAARVRARSGVASARLAELDGYLSHPNVRAFLDTLSQSEGAQYNTLFGGKTFEDYSSYPGHWGAPAGRYQIVKQTYDLLSRMLELDDFSPTTQDRMAAQLIVGDGAMADLLAGNLDKVVARTSGTWASLPQGPGLANRYPTQPYMPYDAMVRNFRTHLEKYGTK